MPKRTTIELDEELLNRAKRALGCTTTRGTVEEALRRAADAVERGRSARGEAQMRYLRRLSKSTDLDILLSDEMWK